MNTEFNKNRIETILNVCSSLSNLDIEKGLSCIRESYPFVPKEREPRNYSDFRKMQIFRRDGFIDRYSGERLVFPGVLKILSNVYPDDFPYHKNWKMTSCHMAWWHLLPTIDHVEPFAAGGRNSEENLVTTSMVHNGIKANYSLGELQWEVHPAGNLKEWDGMTRWFYDYVGENKTLLEDRYIEKWYRVLLRLNAY